MSQRVGPGNTRKRGHQHHPRNHGTRRRQALEPTDQQQKKKCNQNHNITTNIKETTICGVSSINVNNTTSITNINTSAVITSASCEYKENNNKSLLKENEPVNTNDSDILNVIKCDVDNGADDNYDSNSNKNEEYDIIPKPSKCDNDIREEDIQDMSLVYRPAAEGSSQSDQECEDPEMEELARLRCTSERTEVVAERETRRRKRRCADYPGLAFGSSIFSSDTLMKFSIIRNELHNIMNTQLKRVR